MRSGARRSKSLLYGDLARQRPLPLAVEGTSSFAVSRLLTATSQKLPEQRGSVADLGDNVQICFVDLASRNNLVAESVLVMATTAFVSAN